MNLKPQRIPMRWIESHFAIAIRTTDSSSISARGGAANAIPTEVAQRTPGSAILHVTDQSDKQARGASGGSVWSDGSLARQSGAVKPAVLAPAVDAASVGKPRN